MDLVSLVIVLVVVGFLLWLLTTYIPLDPAVKKIITAVVVVVLCLWILRMFVPIPFIPVGR